MGRGPRAGTQEKQNNRVRTVWKDTERSVKREQLDIIASICGTTRDTTGEVQRRTSNEHDDGATAAAANERASESSSDSGISTATV